MFRKSRAVDPIGIAASEPSLIRQAWRRVRLARGGAGIDGETLDAFGKRADQAIAKLAEGLAVGNYRFSRMRETRIPKAKGKMRTLEIPTVSDRVVLQAVRMVIEPACEARMHPCSHAYRPCRGAMTALDAIFAAMSRGLQVVLETDIENFFGSVRHDNLMRELNCYEPRTAASSLVGSALGLSAGRWRRRIGLPQGSPLSPLLANVSLTCWDSAVQNDGWVVVRYADDLLVLCDSQKAAGQAQRQVANELRRLGLRMHSGKTRMVDSRREQFAFLGFQFLPDRLVPDESNLRKFRESIAEWSDPGREIGWGERLQRINGLVRSFGWYYHRTDAARLFCTLDHDIMMGLRELAMARPAPSDWEGRLERLGSLRQIGWSGKRRRGGIAHCGYGS
jgi:RNA-directed DNA polymerase